MLKNCCWHMLVSNFFICFSLNLQNISNFLDIRGFMTSNGQPDQSRSARIVLKDYVNGKLIYCYAPPGVDQSSFQTFPERQKAEMKIELLPPRQQRAMKIDKSQAEAIDDQFFKTQNLTAYVKGRYNFPNVRSGALCVQSGVDGSSTASVNGSMVSLAGVGEKPWKHRKKQKREKLRKTYAHLDEH